MNKPHPPRTVPPANAPVRTAVRSARRPAPVREEGSWLARAWARHPLVAMVRYRPRLTFFQGLHSMIRAGIALPIAFTELSRGAARDGFRRAVAQVGEAVAAGSGLAEAMRRAPVWFESRTVELLGVAEASGTLEAALARIIEQLQESQRMRLRAAMLCLYPAYLLIAFIFGGGLLDTASVLLATGNTDAFLSVFLTQVVQKVLWVSGFGLAAFVAPLLLGLPALEPHWMRVRMHIPLLGRFHRELQASRFSLTLGVALGAGLEAARSLEMALESTGDVRLRARAGLAIQSLRSGASLTDVVERLGVFDGESLQRLSTGERTGHLEPILAQVSREHAEAGMRWLRALMFAVIALLAVVLVATNIGKIGNFRAGYIRQLNDLSKAE